MLTLTTRPCKGRNKATMPNSAKKRSTHTAKRRTHTANRASEPASKCPAGKQREYTVTSAEQAKEVYTNISDAGSGKSIKCFVCYDLVMLSDNFYLINRKEYIKGNNLLSGYVNFSKNNLYGAHYAELKKFIEHPRNPMDFFKFSIQPV